MNITRRGFLKLAGATIAEVTLVQGSLAEEFQLPQDTSIGQRTTDPTVEQWMNDWMKAVRAPEGALHLSRFVEPIYFLTKPIAWKPNPGQEADFQAISVPTGFVTDFASIPRVFWSVLRPDGEYTYPAIIHDFLYWTQSRPRDVADKIFQLGMQDFDISASTIALIYDAVRIGGATAWNTNTKLKSQGEKRVLKRFPDDPRTRWQDWKVQPDNFI